MTDVLHRLRLRAALAYHRLRALPARARLRWLQWRLRRLERRRAVLESEAFQEGEQ